jgi:hypothetical protein
LPCIRPWISRLIYTITVLLIGGIVWASFEDPATYWAPGHLSRHHTDIERCTQCHEPFVGPTPHKCVECHSLKQFATRSKVDVRRLHKSVIEQNQSCTACHSEHQGFLAPITVGLTENPHGEFIFRVTRARACSDCHAVESKGDITHFMLLENAQVRHLIHEGEGAHRSGHFARCLNCHIGGQRDIEEENDDDD